MAANEAAAENTKVGVNFEKRAKEEKVAAYEAAAENTEVGITKEKELI